MKKLLFICAVLLSACGGVTTGNAIQTSTEVDSVAVDSTVADTVVADTIVIDSLV